jgi:hypothetical protein
MKLYLLIASVMAILMIGCKKKESISLPPAYNYFPVSVNNEWIYAINDVYNGTDTLQVKVIGNANLSNNQPCWLMAYKDLYGFYNDTNYFYFSNNKDTIITYANQSDSSLLKKWIFVNIKNNRWTGVDTLDKYTFQQPFDSMSGFGITYHNIWNIHREYYQGIYSDIEQLFFEANVGLCSYSIASSTPGGPIEQSWHLISYKLN